MLKLLDKKKYLNNRKFEIKVVKNIPQEAGMGGGSMNAASLINFFTKKKILNSSENEVIELTKQIGSDVILGIKSANVILSSNGNIKKYYKNIKLHALVVKPDFGCSTKNIYSKVKSFSKSRFNFPKSTMLKTEYLKTLDNDLEKIAFKQHPQLKKIKSFLSTLPHNIFVRMSGSGSSIVAYFHSKRACGNAYAQFKRKFSGCWCVTSKTI